MRRIDMYYPLKPGSDPCTLAPKSSFADNDYQPSVEGYAIFENGGEVFVFRTTKQHGCRCAQFLSHGTVIFDNAQGLYTKFDKEAPRRAKVDKADL